eukprot:g11485.t1
MPRGSNVEDKLHGVGLKHRKHKGEVTTATDRDEAASAAAAAAAAQRARRLRRKTLAARVVAHWKSFAREGIAEARARAHAAKLPQRRALARWRAGAGALRSARLGRAADAGRRRFLAESRGLARWRAVARASAASRTATRDAGRRARAHRARVLATLALRRWLEAASLAAARRGMEEAALRAWASGRVYSGLAGLRRHALKHRLGLFLVDRGLAGRRRLLGRKGLAALEAALMQARGEKDLIAEALAGRVRAALARWGRRASVLRARKAIRDEEAFVQSSRLLPGKLRPAFRRWRRFSTTRQHFRSLEVDIATVSRDSPAVPAKDQRRPPPAPAPASTTVASTTTTVGRARAAAHLRRWRLAVSRRRRARARAGLADEFRDHVLLLRHHEHWKAFARSGRAAAALEAAAGRLGRRARMRRALLALGRAAEESAAERDRARPRLREAFFAWDGVCADGLRKRERRAEEGRDRDRRTKGRAMGAWSRRTQAGIAARVSLGLGDRQHRRSSLRGALRAWATVSAEMGLRGESAAASGRHADRRRLETGFRDWRAAAAGIALRRSANTMARDQASKSLVCRTLRAWRERADLQAARKAVFCARVASAGRVIAAGKLRRSLTRWQEVHGSARVATITLLRADGHARRKVLGKIWRAWSAVRDLQKRRKAFRAKVKARRRLSLQRGAFSALVAAAEAGRRERERVSAALLLWKLHTQGKAFAALAAYRLRRRWKQDRARRAVRWRREHLIKDGALRWAATADAIAASRISSAAFREGNRAARRWEAAGRCARHWRRVAAARGMERRARGIEPETETAAPRRRRNGGFSEDVRSLSAVGGGAIRDGGEGCSHLSRAGSRSRLFGDTATERCYYRSRSDVGGIGKENNGRDDGLLAGHSDAGGVGLPTRTAFRSCRSSPAYQKNRTVAAAPIVAAAGRPERGRGGSPAQHPAASWAGVEPGASLKRFGPTDLPAKWAPSLSAPVSRHPLGVSLSHATRAGAATGYQRPRPIGMAAAVAIAEGTTPRDGESSPPSFGGLDRDVASFGEEKEEGRAPPPTTIAVSDLTQLPSPRVPAFTGVLSRLDRDAVEAAAVAAESGDVVAGACDDVPGGDGGDGVGRRRPAPRRPLELLLDETARYSAAASDGGRQRAEAGQGGGRRDTSKGVAPPPPPLSTWVVDEMNRLFGVRNPGATSGVGAAFGGDQGHNSERGVVLRSAVGEVRRPTIRDASRGQGLSWSAGAQPWRGTGDGGSLGGHQHHRLRYNHTQRAGGEPLLQPMTHQQENIPVATGGQATWSNDASVPPPPTPAARLDQEHSLRHAQTTPTPRTTSTLTSSSPPPLQAADAREGGPRTAAPASVRGSWTQTSATIPREDPTLKDEGDVGEGRRAKTPSPSPSAEPPLATDSLVADFSTPGFHEADASGASAPAPSASQDTVSTCEPYPTGVPAAGARAPSASSVTDVVGGGHDAIVLRQSMSARAQLESASLPEEQALEARVADAERRLLALKEHARQRRRDKRELAALHQALAEQEGRQGGASCGSGGDGSGGDVEPEGVDGAVGLGVRRVGMEGIDDLEDHPSVTGRERTARKSLPPPAADSFPIEANAKQDSAVVGVRTSDGELAAVAPASRSAPLDAGAVPRAYAPSPPRDESSTAGGGSPTESESDSRSRRALLVRLGFVRARLEAGGSGGGQEDSVRPVAESLRREVEELAKSGVGVAAAVAAGGVAALGE